MMLREYHLKPAEVDEMPSNDVNMILYQRQANYINRKVEDLNRKAGIKGHRKVSTPDPDVDRAFNMRFGEGS